MPRFETRTFRVGRQRATSESASITEQDELDIRRSSSSESVSSRATRNGIALPSPVGYVRSTTCAPTGTVALSQPGPRLKYDALRFSPRRRGALGVSAAVRSDRDAASSRPRRCSPFRFRGGTTERRAARGTSARASVLSASMSAVSARHSLRLSGAAESVWRRVKPSFISHFDFGYRSTE